MKNCQSYVEVKIVTWAKDSHGLFDYESKNVLFSKNKIDYTSKIFKEGSEVVIKSTKDADSALLKEKNPSLFSIVSENERNESFNLKIEESFTHEYSKSNSLFLIVRSLKNEDGTQKGYNLEVGDIIRLGRIEYRVIEFQDHNLNKTSMLSDEGLKKPAPFSLVRKPVASEKTDFKKQCRICLLDETEMEGLLVNPCSCKGTSEYVHIKCLQDWISSKSKKKANPGMTCSYWKKLNCEVCKVSLPDVVDDNGKGNEVIPLQRPETPYILLERVFYDKSKENSDNSKMLVLLNLTDQNHHIKLGRGHECDLRENDISVSRLHAFIKYVNGNFVITDNNSKFGTLILLRKSYKIERKKIALQIGRTVMTFSLKQTSINNIPIFKNPNLMEKFTKASPKDLVSVKPLELPSNKPTKPSANIVVAAAQNNENNANKQQDINGSFIDD